MAKKVVTLEQILAKLHQNVMLIEKLTAQGTKTGGDC